MDGQTTPASLLPEGAFVVQFRAGADIEHGLMMGRVEHVVSGQAVRFGSLAELTAFFAWILSTLPLTPASSPAPAGSAREPPTVLRPGRARSKR